MKRKLLHWYRAPGRIYRRMLPRRIRRMVLVPLAIVIVGTITYPLIEGPPWTLFDGLYMTVITLTTVGYGEIPQVLSRPGRLFTILLSLGGIFVMFYIATDIIRSVVTGELRDLLGKERMDDQLKHMVGHTIVCGFGRMGKIVCDELEKLHQRFVVLDSTPPGTDEWTYHEGIRLLGDATDDDVLRRAGIERARALIAAVGSDASNLYITLSARLLNPKLNIVARAEEHVAEKKLRKVGANKVISPYLAGGHLAVQAVFKPTLHQFMDASNRSVLLELEMEELMIERGSDLAGQRLHNTPLITECGISVVSMVRPNGEVINAPGGDVVLEPGCTLIVIGKRPQLALAESYGRNKGQSAG